MVANPCFWSSIIHPNYSKIPKKQMTPETKNIEKSKKQKQAVVILMEKAVNEMKKQEKSDLYDFNWQKATIFTREKQKAKEKKEKEKGH